MPEWMKMTDEFGPEKIVHVYDPEVGMKGVAVVHTTAFGRCAGGTRMAPDITTEEVVLLAKTMTYKYTIYGILVGGGKAGIWADPGIRGAQREAIFRAFGKALKPLFDAGVFYGEDMGVDAHDVANMHEGAGLSSGRSNLGQQLKDGEPLDNHATGYGLVVAAKAACEFAGMELKGATVAIEGFGKVGGGAARYMAEEGAKVVAISTIHGTAYNKDGLDIKKLLEARKESGDRAVEEYEDAQHIDRGMIYFLPVDILVPGARPYVIDKNNANRIQAKVISPAANIPATDEAIEILFQRGIHFIPDFVANIGGSVLPFTGRVGGTADDAFRSMRELVGPLTHEVLAGARKEGITPMSLAIRMAREKVLKIRAEKKVLSDDEWLKLQRQNFKI